MEKTKINKKEAGIGPFKKITVVVTIQSTVPGSVSNYFETSTRHMFTKVNRIAIILYKKQLWSVKTFTELIGSNKLKTTDTARVTRFDKILPYW